MPSANETRVIRNCQKVQGLAATIKTALTELEVIFQDQQRGFFDTGVLSDPQALANTLNIADIGMIRDLVQEAHDAYTGRLYDRLSSLV